MTQPLFGLEDVNAHLEALFLIAEADEAGISPRFEDRLDMMLERQDLRAIIRYLAAYGATLCRQANQHIPGEPGPSVHEIIHGVAKIVSLSVPRPE